MNKNRAENFKFNKKFLTWSTQADGKSEKTVKQLHYHLLKFTHFLGTRSYKQLTSTIIISFKDNLKDSGVSTSSYCSALRTIRRFLSWLMSHQGFKRKITPNLISYMSPTAEETRMAQQPAFRNVMPLESVIKLHNSIPGDNPIGMRDRAIISMLISTGIRHKALVSLPLSCVDLTNNIIHQDPARGVDTKYKKCIKSVVCAVDGIFQESLTKWEQYLRSHGFGAADPFIPRAKRTYDTVSNCFALSKDVEPKYWKSHRSLSDVLRKRCKQAGLPYFPPHNFRHLLVKLVKELDLTSKQSKCFSQSLGHEHEDTTYGCYGKFSEDVVLSTVAGINFKNNNQSIDIDEERYKEFQAFQNWEKLKKKIKKEDK